MATIGAAGQAGDGFVAAYLDRAGRDHSKGRARSRWPVQDRAGRTSLEPDEELRTSLRGNKSGPRRSPALFQRTIIAVELAGYPENNRSYPTDLGWSGNEWCAAGVLRGGTNIVSAE